MTFLSQTQISETGSYGELALRSKSLLFLAMAFAISALAVSQAQSQITVDAGSSVTFSFTPHLDQQTGNLEYLYNGVTANVSLTPHVPLVVPVSFHQTISSAWSNPLNWGGYLLAVDAAQLAVNVVSGPSLLALPGVYDTLKNGGPTEKSVSGEVKNFKSQWLPGGELSINGSLDVRFDVTIPGGKAAIIDQSPVVIESLTVNSGGMLSASTFTTRKNLSNAGSISNLIASVEGDFNNVGTITSRALTVLGSLSNSGTMTLSAPISSVTANAQGLSNTGTLVLAGGEMTVNPFLANFGTVVGHGTFYSNLNQHGSFTANVPGSPLVIYNLGSGLVNNYGDLGASLNATLRLLNCGVTQTAAGYINASGTVELIGSTISGGSVTGGGSLNVYQGTLSNVNNNATIRIYGSTGNNFLNVAGGAFANNGSVIVNYDQYATAKILFGPPTVVSGSGEFVLQNGEFLSSNTVTLPSGQLVRGWGTISATIDNSGIIRAEGNGRVLTLYNGGGYTASITNRNSVECAANSKLTLSSGAIVTQIAPGRIVANGTVELVGGNINGGSISGGGSVNVYQGTFSNVNNSSSVRIYGSSGNNYLNVNGGAFTNNGSVVVNYDQYATAKILFGPPTVVSGSGEFVLQNGEFLSSNTVTLPSGQLVRGWGTISATIDNSGIIRAEGNGRVLTLYNGGGYTASITNRNSVECTANSKLTLSSGAIVTQTVTGRIVAGGTVELIGGTVNGGSISGIGSIDVYQGNFTSVKNNGVVRIFGSTGNNYLSISGGTFENNGSVVVNFNQVASAKIQFDGATTLIGSGEIVLKNGTVDAFQTLTNSTAHRLRGSGTVRPPVVNFGLIEPGIGLGKMSFDRQVNLQSTSWVSFEISGTSKGVTYDAINVSGSMTLGGQLSVVVLKPFQSSLRSTDTFRIIDASSVTGSFANVTSGGRLQTNFGSCLVTVDATGVTLSDFQSGQSWFERYFTMGEQGNLSISGDLADPNDNGASNLLEYAMDRDPKAAGGGSLPSVLFEQEFISLTYQKSKSASDIVFTVEASNDLLSWLPVVTLDDILNDNGSARTIRSRVFVGGATKQFLRLKVNRL